MVKNINIKNNISVIHRLFNDMEFAGWSDKSQI